MITEDVIRVATLYKAAYWKKPWNGFSDMVHYMEGAFKRYQAQQVLDKVSKSPFNRMIWVGKSYSIADLRRDLEGLL